MISIKNLNKTWQNIGNNKTVFSDFSLNISKGDFVAFIGQNGTGKTTLFNIIAGLDKNYSGEIKINDHQKSRVGYVFQNYRQSLFPWVNAEENISYPLKLQGKNSQERRDAVKKLCIEFNVSLDTKKYLYQLSGGQQQMVAILRALSLNPDILLLDEPFSAIDYESTISLISFIQQVWQKTGITILLISHDVDEALLLAKRIIVIGGSPTKIKSEFMNKADYPRTIKLISQPEFGTLKESILEVFINV